MRLTRQQFTAGLAAAAANPSALYRLLDRAAERPPRRQTQATRPLEQHLLPNLEVIRDDGIEVVVPPLHHRVITATLAIGDSPAALHAPRDAFEAALVALEADHPPAPAGVSVTVAWGLPYFRRYVPSQAERALPIDLRAPAGRGRQLRVLEDAERFPSDPDTTILETNDIALLLRSDNLDLIDDAQHRLIDRLHTLFAPTSIRNGWVSGGFGGSASLPKQMAMQANLAGADLIPTTAELFLGFTSTVKQALGPTKIANLETLGYAKLPDAYFRGGTHMHLSHLAENVNAWYLNFTHDDRVRAMFRPGLHVRPATQTIPQGPGDVETAAELHADYTQHQRIGHAGAIQSASRLSHEIRGPDGTVYPKGTAVPQRADFNTLDNPFSWSADPRRDQMKRTPHAGTHFVVFNPTSDDFRRVRLAMDGVLPTDHQLEFAPRSIGQGINSVFHATHRQNYLVPPRSHRSFPLSERRR